VNRYEAWLAHVFDRPTRNPAWYFDLDLGPAVLEVLGYALTLRNAACVESALHGLGHLQGYRRGDVTPMIEDFIRRNPDLRPELLKYAEHAAAGCIQ
jgi:hypothetical protein